MVKTFIQAIDWHHSFRLLRKTLASLPIFSLLASDIAKAMEDDEEKRSVHSVPLILQAPSKAGIIISLED